MDQNFQTSFIPKKPIIEERSTPSRPASLLTIISIFIFFTIALASGGLYFYQGILTKDIATLKGNLELAKGRFEPEKIAILQTLDRRTRAANEVLSSHISTSPVFQALQADTLKTIRYTKFSYDLGSGNNSQITIKLSGQATDYKAVALEADLLTQNKNIIDPVFSGLSLDDKGNVLFDLTFSVDPSFVNYKQVLKTESDNTPSSAADANTGVGVN